MQATCQEGVQGKPLRSVAMIVKPMGRMTSFFGYLNDGCSIWSEDLFNMEQLTNDDTDGRDFYLKLAASEFLSNVHPTLSANSRSKRWKWIFLALVVSMTLSTTALFYCMWRRRKLQKKGEDLLKFDIGTSVGPANCT
ncbi:G-type lectin S-receptor-like serine/threonine-protein kinase [Camellia lanceoleosa]|nr:G-type lectin S-receptor-like serine/threonine-protein kinase [Camellia lanceoleosa]